MVVKVGGEVQSTMVSHTSVSCIRYMTQLILVTFITFFNASMEHVGDSVMRETPVSKPLFAAMSQ